MIYILFFFSYFDTTWKQYINFNTNDALIKTQIYALDWNIKQSGQLDMLEY